MGIFSNNFNKSILGEKMIVRNCPYVMVTEEILRNKELSWEAKGFYAFLSCLKLDEEIDMHENLEELINELISIGCMELIDGKFTLIK
jgi:hypothetical protein